jgi:hypothetical protein
MIESAEDGLELLKRVIAEPTCQAVTNVGPTIGTASAELFCFLPVGHEGAYHYDEVDGIWWRHE